MTYISDILFWISTGLLVPVFFMSRSDTHGNVY